MPTFFLDPHFTGDVTRAPFPRQIVLYDPQKNDWSSCTDENILASTDYLAISYRQTDFPDKAKLEETIRNVCDFLNINAYWLDIACTGTSIEEKNRDLFRIADVFRGAKKTLILISGNDKNPQSPGWLSWGDRLWTLPEALLSQVLLFKVGSRRIEEVSLRQIANLAYKDRGEEMMLIEGYSGKDPLPLAERVELLRSALWKRSSGPSNEHIIQTGSLFGKYPAERVYALMGFMQYRIMPDPHESEESALSRLLVANKLGNQQFSWYTSPKLAIDSSTVPESDSVATLDLQALQLKEESESVSHERDTQHTQHTQESNLKSGNSGIAERTQAVKAEEVTPPINAASQSELNDFARLLRACKLSGEVLIEEELPEDLISENTQMQISKLLNDAKSRQSIFDKIAKQTSIFIEGARSDSAKIIDAFGLDKLDKSQIETLRNLTKRQMNSKYLTDLERVYLQLKLTLLMESRTNNNSSENTEENKRYMIDDFLDVIRVVQSLRSDNCSIPEWLGHARKLYTTLLFTFQDGLGDCGAIPRDDCLEVCQWSHQIWRLLSEKRSDIISRGMAECLESLASCFYQLGRLDEAQKAIEASIELNRKLEHDFTLARSMVVKSLVLTKRGEYIDAIPPIRDIVQMRYKWAPGYLINTEFQSCARSMAYTLESIIEIVVQKDQDVDRIQLYPEVLRLLRGLSQAHQDAAAALSVSLQKISQMHLRNSDLTSALQYSKEAHSYSQTSLSSRRPDLMASSSEVVAESYLALKQTLMASIILQQAITIRRKLPSDSQNQYLATDYDRLSRICYDEQNYSEAYNAANEAVKFCRNLPLDSSALRSSLRQLAKCAKKWGLIDEAIEAENEAKKI